MPDATDLGAPLNATIVIQIRFWAVRGPRTAGADRPRQASQCDWAQVQFEGRSYSLYQLRCLRATARGNAVHFLRDTCWKCRDCGSVNRAIPFAIVLEVAPLERQSISPSQFADLFPTARIESAASKCFSRH